MYNDKRPNETDQYVNTQRYIFYLSLNVSFL